MSHSDYYGTGHGQGELPDDLPMDALSRRARRKKEQEEWQRARCTCGHNRLSHDDGRGQCFNWFHVSDDEDDVQCWCTEFEDRNPTVPPEWRQTS
jgi:hypothetical protein